MLHAWCMAISGMNGTQARVLAFHALDLALGT